MCGGQEREEVRREEERKHGRGGVAALTTTFSSRDQIFAADASFRVLSSRNERESRNMRSSKLFVTSSHGKLLNVSIQNHNRR